MNQEEKIILFFDIILVIFYVYICYLIQTKALTIDRPMMYPYDDWMD